MSDRPMQGVMGDFIRALRDSEVRVSPAEAIEAHQAAADIGFSDRTLLRDALCVTLAKTGSEVVRFEACFDEYFSRVRPALPNDPSSAPEGAPELARQILEGDDSALASAMEAASASVGAGEIRLNTQRSLLTRRLLDEMGLRDVEALIQQLRSRNDAEGEALAERLADGRRALFAAARAHVDREARLHASESARRLRESRLADQSLAATAPEDEEAMLRLVRRMAKRLAERHGHRRRRAKRGKLDARTTLRRSLDHGGVPFEVAWKHRRVDRPKILVMCDVSRSVASVAQFLLLFLYALSEVVERLDAYAFSDRLAPVNDLLRNDSANAAMAGIIGRIGLRPTDYGRVLGDLRDQAEGKIDRRTTVIILGDARSNGADPRRDLMREVADRARAVIWLNPEPPSLWDQGDSEMQAYRRFCTVAVSCNTLRGLERVIDDVLRTYVAQG